MFLPDDAVRVDSKVAISAIQQWLEIYSRIYGNDKSRSSANEGGADSYGLQIMCPRKAWPSSALA